MASNHFYVRINAYTVIEQIVLEMRKRAVILRLVDQFIMTRRSRKN
jgi:hypothetical protein